jgi:hypothetical protein
MSFVACELDSFLLIPEGPLACIPMMANAQDVAYSLVHGKVGEASSILSSALQWENQWNSTLLLSVDPNQ